MGGKTSAKAKNDWIAKAYDRINLTVPKGRKVLLQEAAKAQHGGKVNSLINALIDAELARQGLIPSEPPQSPTGASTTPEGTAPPQEPEPPQEREPPQEPELLQEPHSVQSPLPRLPDRHYR